MVDGIGAAAGSPQVDDTQAIFSRGCGRGRLMSALPGLLLQTVTEH